MIGALRGDQKQAQRVALTAAGACALTGVVMAMRPELAVFVAAGAMLVALSLDWRRGVVALLVVLPFAGLPVFVAGTPGLAARDLFVVAPLYLAFAVGHAPFGRTDIAAARRGAAGARALRGAWPSRAWRGRRR